MALNPRITKDARNAYWLEWTPDPEAIAYDIITPAGVHVQAGKKHSSAKLGVGLTEPVVAKIAAAEPGDYETARFP